MPLQGCIAKSDRSKRVRLMIVKGFLSVSLLALQSQMCFADEGPLSKAQFSLKQAEDFCLEEGHEFRLIANPIVTVDLGGTTELEVIFDYGALQCLGDSWLYRGSMGAAVDIYASEDEDGYLSKSGYDLVPFEGHWAARFKMNELFENDECSGSCSRYVYVDGLAIVETYRQ